MKRPYLFLSVALTLTCLLVVGLGYTLYRTQARLQDASQQVHNAQNQAQKAEKRRQEALSQWQAYNRAELRAIAQKMQPTLWIANSQGGYVKINHPIPPVAGLQVIASVDKEIEAYLANEFQYEVTKARTWVHRGGQKLNIQERQNNQMDLANMNTRPADVVAIEVLEMYRTDKQGYRELVKPKNPVLRFALR